MFNQPYCIQLVGLPGSGKSTFRRKLSLDAVVISTDDYVERFASLEGKTYSEAFKDCIGKATSAAKADFRSAVAQGRNIIVDRTNLTRKARADFMLGNGYTNVAVVFPKAVTDCISICTDPPDDRIGKTIAADIVFAMFKRYEAPSESEGFDIVLRVDQ